jgi:hypothetical protein
MVCRRLLLGAGGEFLFVTNALWPHPGMANVLRAIWWREYRELVSGEILENFSSGAKA